MIIGLGRRVKLLGLNRGGRLLLHLHLLQLLLDSCRNLGLETLPELLHFLVHETIDL